MTTPEYPVIDNLWETSEGREFLDYVGDVVRIPVDELNLAWTISKAIQVARGYASDYNPFVQPEYADEWLNRALQLAAWVDNKYGVYSGISTTWGPEETANDIVNKLRRIRNRIIKEGDYTLIYESEFSDWRNRFGFINAIFEEEVPTLNSDDAPVDLDPDLT